ncbi:MAG TPA: MarR family transcriptional regulator [Mycobacteriales bacterium]|nr:MarR family transcriptional regulator [Mycobacteriales bacterium]
MSPVDPQLRTAIRVLVRLSRVLVHTDTGLTVPQYRTLALISRGEEHASRVAERLAVAKPTVTAMVDGLVAAGLLERIADPRDRRATKLRLTAAGEQALARADAVLCERLGPVFAGVSDRDRLLELFAELGEALDRDRADRRERRSRRREADTSDSR